MRTSMYVYIWYCICSYRLGFFSYTFGEDPASDEELGLENIRSCGFEIALFATMSMCNGGPVGREGGRERARERKREGGR